MALDKLVDSTQLDSDLTSVANAIRAKSGGSSQLAFPAGFVSEIGNIPSGGGGVKTETGSFYVTISGGEASHTITHNLNTNKVFGIVWEEVGENDTLVQTEGYELLYLTFLSHSYANDLYSGSTLYNSVTTSAKKTIAYADEPNPYLARYRGSWKNAAASWDRSALMQQCVSAATTTSVTVSLSHAGGSGVAYFARYKTYHWKLWALE